MRSDVENSGRSAAMGSKWERLNAFHSTSQEAGYHTARKLKGNFNFWHCAGMCGGCPRWETCGPKWTHRTTIEQKRTDKGHLRPNIETNQEPSGTNSGGRPGGRPGGLYVCFIKYTCSACDERSERLAAIVLYGLQYEMF